jgi:hypothetical protein
MMMPANYSVIAENELSYVEGGASFIDWVGDRTATVWNAANVKTFNTNVVTIVGNAFVDDMVHSTLGYVFGGNADWKGIGSAIKGFFVAENKNVGDSIAHTLGNVAAVYLLGNTTVANKAGDVKLKAGSPASKTFSVIDKDGNWNEILKVVG